MTASALLASLLAFAPPAPAGDTPVEEAPSGGIGVAVAAAEPVVDPFIAAVRSKLSAEDAQAFDAMTDADLDALAAKLDNDETLTDREKAISEAFMKVGAEQFESGLGYQSGDVELSDGLAVLHLGEDFRYLGPDDANRVLVEAWGNPPGPRTLGMILPADISPLDPDAGWGVIVTFAEDGYVEDDDADDIDYDELLEQMQEATKEDNKSRVAQGYEPMQLVGWAESPHYDEAGHRLYWAKELAVEGAPVNSLNYSIRVLGRRGVLELNAVATMGQMSQIKPAMEKVLSRVEFNQGHRYEDFDPDLDKVAAYGIGGLIAGKVLAKAGFFAVILKFLVAAKKFLIVGALAIGVAIKGLFSRRRRSEVEGGEGPGDDANA